MTAPRFVTLEGGEGAGKSTHLQRLGASMRAIGETVVLTREPGGSEGAEEIRSLLVGGAVGRWEPMTEALLHYAARRDHVERTIRPALDAGSWVISDRFADSTMAYQGYGQGLARAAIEELHRVVLRPSGTGRVFSESSDIGAGFPEHVRHDVEPLDVELAFPEALVGPVEITAQHVVTLTFRPRHADAGER